MRVTYGLPCASGGCPVAVEVFAGNAPDPSTVAAQVDRVRRRLGTGRVAPVGDRGMTATARIRGDLAPAGLDWIPALGTGDIRRLLKAEVTGPDLPGGRPMVCPSPRPRQERARRRGDPLRATERTLEAAAARRGPGPANRDRTLRG